MHKFFKIIVTIMVALTVMPVTISATDSRISVFECNGPSNSIVVVSKGNDRVYSRLGVYASPGATLTVNTTYSTTITSNANFTLFPELFELGYSTSITAGIDIGWSKTNNTNSNQELVIIEVYDVVRAIEYYEVSSGVCAVGTNTLYDMPTGWGFDLR